MKAPSIQNSKLFWKFFTRSIIYYLIVVMCGGLVFLYQKNIRQTDITRDHEAFSEVVERTTNAFDNIYTELSALAVNPLFTHENPSPEACNKILDAFIELQPEYLDIELVRQDGTLVCDTDQHATDVDKEQRANTIASLKSFHIGNLIQRENGQFRLKLIMPVFGHEATIAGALFVDLDANWLNVSIVQKQLPNRVLVTLIDRDGVVIARNKNIGTWQGRNISTWPTYQRVVIERDLNSIFNDLDGTPRKYQTTRIGSLESGYIDIVFGSENPSITFFTPEMLGFLGGSVALYALLIYLLWRRTIYSTAAEQWEIFANTAPVHIIFTDPDGRIIYTNPAVETITGYSKKEILGKTPRLWGGIMPKRFYKEFWETIKFKKQPYHGIVHNRRKNGEAYTADMRVAPVLDKSGELTGFVGVELDITDQVRNSTELARHDAMQSTFLQVLMHRLRTPISVARWNLEQLMDGTFGTIKGPMETALVATHRACLETNEHLNDVLNAVSVKNGALAVSKGTTHVPNILHVLQNRFAGRFKNKRIKITYAITHEPDTEHAYIDERLIEGAMMKILQNALDYTPSNGKVTVKLTIRESGIVFSVADTGIGIPPKELPNLFELFFRGTNAGTMSTEGYGIGLFLVKAYVEAHGGTVTVSSKLGKGSTFGFTIPYAKHD